MNWKDFLQKLTVVPSIDIVGPFASSWSPSDRPALFVDSGARWQKPIALSATVGDGDSSFAKMDFLLEKEKDYSDFAFALRSLPQNIVEIFLHGFLGGRRDHELANFGEAHAFLKARLTPTVMSWDSDAISWSAGEWDLEWYKTFSLMAFESARVSIEGKCRYQVSTPSEFSALSSFGLSNEGNGRIHIRTEGPLFCFLDR